MRSVFTVVLVAVAGATLLGSRGGRAAVACAGPGQSLVRITAQQLSDSPPSYAFLVTNLAPAAISGIVIGRHDRTLPIRGVAPNVPARMDSPTGWAGQHVFVEESPYMYYLWENKDPSKRIVAQQSVAGFRITLPDAKTDPGQVTFNRIPFEVALADGSCRSGIVGLDTIPK
jgi:hypothetical protein